MTAAWNINRFCVAALISLLAASSHEAADLVAAQDESTAALERAYGSAMQPLLRRYCFECHSGKRTEAEIDLAEFTSVATLRKQVKIWVRVREMLDSSQMPPKDSPQPTDDERTRLRTWVREFLTSEAKARAGDPGPVVLRRLNNAEYNYTVRDLTSVESLDPTREFPIDGAAGEGLSIPAQLSRCRRRW